LNQSYDKTYSADFRTATNLMKKNIPITSLFLDVGGVLLTNGWDHHARRRATKHFKLDWAEMEERHGLNFETHEEDKITFNEYLDRVVFYQKRPFTRAEFRRFMFAQSKSFAEMIELVRNLKAKYGLKIIVVSNESRELNAYRIRQVQAGRVCGRFYFFLLRSSPKTRRGYFQAGAGHSPDARPADCLYRKHAAVRPRSQKVWGFAAFFTRITNQPARNWLRLDYSLESSMKPGDSQILTINGGSSSIKFALYEAVKPLKRRLYGTVDRIGLRGTNLTAHDADGKPSASCKLIADRS
jgi:hypothetical protein